MVVALDKYSLSDMDRDLKRDLMDIVDYNYRFKEDDNCNLEDIIEQSLPELEEKVRKFYDGIDGVDFNLSVEDIATNYRNTMM